MDDPHGLEVVDRRPSHVQGHVDRGDHRPGVVAYRRRRRPQTVLELLVNDRVATPANDVEGAAQLGGVVHSRLRVSVRIEAGEHDVEVARPVPAELGPSTWRTREAGADGDGDRHDPPPGRRSGRRRRCSRRRARTSTTTPPPWRRASPCAASPPPADPSTRGRRTRGRGCSGGARTHDRRDARSQARPT